MPPWIISTHCEAVEFRAIVVSGFLFTLFVLTIAGKKIMSLQLNSSCFALCSSLFAVLSNKERVIKGKKVIVSL